MQKIRRDDEIIVIAGKDKGKRGKVLKVLADDRLIVGGVNLIKRHTKPNPMAGVQGGIVEKEAPLHVSTSPFSMVRPTRPTAWVSRLKTARKFASSSRPRNRSMLEHC